MSSCVIGAGDMVIIRGNNFPPIKWQFLSSENPDVIFPLDGSVFKLTIVWQDQKIEATSGSADFTIDLATSILTWTYTVAQSRSLPLGNLARYELERWIDGTQQTMIQANVIVSEGDNPDI